MTKTVDVAGPLKAIRRHNPTQRLSSEFPERRRIAPPAHVSRFFRSFLPLFIASSSESTAQAERSSVHIPTG
nr:Hypothetical protein SC2p2_01520 [Methylocystis sp. SC2]